MVAIKLEGILPPIPTPFDEEGEIETNALLRNLKYWSSFSLAGCVVLGSNGESVHLSEYETQQVLETARAGIAMDRLMIAGVGRPSTRETITWTRNAASIGASAALVLPPSYFRGQMTPQILVNYFKDIAEASPLPVILYNMPACTGIDMDAEIVLALADHENIVGLKDSGGNVTKLGEIRYYANEQFSVLAGSAGFLVPALSMGASGGILALANIAPQQCLEMYNAAKNRNWKMAQTMQLNLIRSNTAVTRGWGVPALKAAMDVLGLYGGAPRAPLARLAEPRYSKLMSILAEAGIVASGYKEMSKK